jgi:hypothetical protein
VPDFPDIRRGTKFSQTIARQWQNLQTVAESISRISVAPPLRIRRSGRHVALSMAPTKPMAAVAAAVAAGIKPYRLVLLKPAEEFPDHLYCMRPGDDPEGEDFEPILVAKPYKIRQTPFDGKTVGGIEYAYDDPITRTAKRPGGIGEPTWVSEVQTIIPRYLHQAIGDDQIMAIPSVIGGTTVVYPDTDPPDPEAITIHWLEWDERRTFTRVYRQPGLG